MSEIPFIRDLEVKPYSTDVSGIVTFTTGVTLKGSTVPVLVSPNQSQCEAYGYTYDIATGTCSAFRLNIRLSSSFANESNKTFGVNNTTRIGTNNTLVMGENNTINGNSRNSIITGNKNQIAAGINNANVSGTSGEATADNSTVLGGNNPTDALGKRQSIRVMFGKQTTSAATVASNLNNTAASYFEIPDNTILYFHASVVAVRVGGTSASGAPGDYLSLIERGVAINKSGVLSIQRERDVIKSSGTTTGWVASAAVSGTTFRVNVRGANNMTLEWACDVKFTQIKTGVTL